MTTVKHAGAVDDTASAVSDAELEYVSPFRDATAVQIAQRRRLARYPTTSATSGYTMVNPSDLGYKTLDSHQQRAKDIAFPVYLSNNEKRQSLLLEKLKVKENYLKHLRDSQVVTDLRPSAVKETAEKEPEKEPEEKPEEEDEEVAEVQEAVAPEVATGEEHENVEGGESVDNAATDREKIAEIVDQDVGLEAEAAEENAVPEIGDGDEEVAVRPVGTTEEVSTDQDVKAVQAIVAPEEADDDKPVTGAVAETAAEDETHQKEEDQPLSPPIDPLLAPRVPLPADADKGFKLPWFKSSHPKTEHPVATPENPEEIVITAQEGYLDKAVYDKIQYETKVHKDWLNNFNEIEEKKYYDRKLDYSNKLKAVQAEIDGIHSEMVQLRKESAKTLEICDGELTRKLLESTQVHVNKKHKIFKETDFLREQKLKEKDLVVDKSAEVQKEIVDLNESKSKVQAEYIGWSNRLADLSAHIDAKVSKLFVTTEQSRKTQSEIDKLNETKERLKTDIENDNLKHDENTKILENVKNKEYLPQLNDIDNQITSLLEKMALIKREAANERCELTAITKKVEEERRAHEEKLKLEAEERKRKEDDLLNKQREELETIAAETRLHHEEELAKMKESYEELQMKLKEQETKHNELKEIQERERSDAVEKEKELKELHEQERQKAVKSEKELEDFKTKAKEPAEEQVVAAESKASIKGEDGSINS